jgi:hypothetical protein
MPAVRNGVTMKARYVNFVSMNFEGRQSLHDQPMFSPAASAILISSAISRCSDAYERKMIMVNHLGTARRNGGIGYPSFMQVKVSGTFVVADALRFLRLKGHCELQGL